MSQSIWVPGIDRGVLFRADSAIVVESDGNTSLVEIGAGLLSYLGVVLPYEQAVSNLSHALSFASELAVWKRWEDYELVDLSGRIIRRFSSANPEWGSWFTAAVPAGLFSVITDGFGQFSTEILSSAPRQTGDVFTLSKCDGVWDMFDLHEGSLSMFSFGEQALLERTSLQIRFGSPRAKSKGKLVYVPGSALIGNRREGRIGRAEVCIS